MRRSLRAAGFVAVVLFAALLGYAPLWSAGFVGDDLPFLARAARSLGGGATALAEDLAQGDGPLARLSLWLSWRIYAGGGTWESSHAPALRVENFLLLVGTAACARLALRRALAPWSGLDGASAAAGAFGVFLICHPLALPAVASVRARGDLLAALFCAAAAVLFLRGRQERRQTELAVSAGAAILAGLASGIALLLPLLLAGLEILCARRNRPLHARLRTGATTLLVFGACVAFESLVGPLFGSAAFVSGAFGESIAALRTEGALGRIAGAIGAVAVPVPAVFESRESQVKVLIYASTAALLLAALHPALVAARSAPRSWGWIATAVLLGVLLSLLRAPPAYGAPEPLAALWLFPAAAVASAGFAVASTALSGTRRVLIPAVLAAGACLLARAAAAPWTSASAGLGELQDEIEVARGEHGGRARYFVVDPPGRIEGLEVAGAALPLTLEPSLCSSSDVGDAARLRGISHAALLAFAREPEFKALRTEGIVILGPATEGDASAAPTAEPSPSGVPPRRALVVPPAPPSSGTLTWREDLRSPLLDVDPLEKRALSAAALPTISTALAPRMGWRAGESQTHARDGVWIEGLDGPVALFDLASAPQWLFGPRVRRVWLEPEIGRIVSAEILGDLPPGRTSGTVEVRGEVRGDARGETWTVRNPPSSWPRPLRGETRCVLTLLALDDLRYVELPAEPEASASDVDELVFVLPRAAAGFAAEGSRIAWSLELRTGDACIARVSGRR